MATAAGSCFACKQLLFSWQAHFKGGKATTRLGVLLVHTGDATHRSTVTTTSTAADYDSELYSSVSPQASSLATGTSSRPMSAALRDVRGSRPNSAAIAAQIEGFENDFLVSNRSSCCLVHWPRQRLDTEHAMCLLCKPCSMGVLYEAAAVAWHRGNISVRLLIARRRDSMSLVSGTGILLCLVLAVGHACTAAQIHDDEHARLLLEDVPEVEHQLEDEDEDDEHERPNMEEVIHNTKQVQHIFVVLVTPANLLAGQTPFHPHTQTHTHIHPPQPPQDSSWSSCL